MAALLAIAVLVTPAASARERDSTQLTSDERAWIAANPTFHVAAFHLPPYMFEENGEATGYQVEYLRAASQRVGLVPEFSWQALPEVDEKLRRGEADVTLDRTRAAGAFLLLSDRVLETQFGIFARDDASAPRDVADLDGRTIASFDGYLFEAVLRKLLPRSRFVRAGDHDGMLRLVASGEADACVTEMQLGRHGLRRAFLASVRQTGVFELPGKASVEAAAFGVRRDLPILKSILEKAHSMVPAAVHQEIWDGWFAYDPQPPRDTAQVLPATPAVTAGAVLASLLVLALLLWGLIRLVGTRLPAETQRLGPHVVVAVVTSLLLGTLAAATWYGLRRLELQQRAARGEALNALVQTAQGASHSWFAGEMGRMERLARRPAVVEAAERLLAARAAGGAKGAEPARRELARQLDTFARESGGIGLDLVAPDSFIIASRNEARVGHANTAAARHPRRLRRALQGSTTLIPLQSGDGTSEVPASAASDERATIVLMAPVRAAGGRTLAVLAGEYPVAAGLTRMARLGRPGESGETYAFDRRGRMLTPSRFDEQLRELVLVSDGSPEPHVRLGDPGGNLLQGHRPTRPAAERPLTRMAAAATAGRSGIDTSGYRDYRGVRVLGAWVWDDMLQVGFTREVDEAEALASLNSARVYGVAGLVVVLLLIAALLGVLMFGGHRATRAIQEARDDWERLARQRTAALEVNERLFRSLFEDAQDAVLVCVEGQFVDCNPASLAMFGYDDKEAFCPAWVPDRMPTLQRDDHESATVLRHGIAEAEEGRVTPFEWRWLRSDGTAFTAEVQLSPTEYHGGHALQFRLRDITAQRAAEARSAQLLQVVEQGHDMVIITDLSGGHRVREPGVHATHGLHPRGGPRTKPQHPGVRQDAARGLRRAVAHDRLRRGVAGGRAQPGKGWPRVLPQHAGLPAAR